MKTKLKILSANADANVTLGKHYEGTIRDNTFYFEDDCKLRRAWKINTFDYELGDDTAVKFDSGKVDYELIPAEVLESLADVLTYGANKYSADNWKGLDESRIRSSFWRHFQDVRQGKLVDKDSGKRSAALLLANAVFLCYFDIKKASEEQ